MSAEINKPAMTVIVSRVVTGDELGAAITYIDSHFETPTHQEYLKNLIHQQALQIYTARLGEQILGLRTFIKVLTPWRGMMQGYISDLDLANGYDIEPDLTALN